MSEQILILVATMSGTAEMVAEEIADRLEDAGEEARIMRMEKADIAILGQTNRLIVCSSTYGTGEVPDNGKPLWEALKSERPDLSHMKFGVVSLGDGQYPETFCFGGKHFDELLEELGAERVIDRAQHDRRGKEYPEDVGGDWAEEWLDALD